MGFNYIVFSKTDGTITREIPIIYPDILVHADVAAQFVQLPGMEKCIPVRAGSLDLSVDDCSGSSRTLNLVSGEDQDTQLINSYPYFHGIT